MTHLDSLHPAIALIAAVLLIIGATLTVIGNLGLVRLRSFYERLHAPTLGTSWGTASTIIASALIFSSLGSRLVVHELAIGVFVMVTMPIALLLLGRAAYRRDPGKAPPSGRPAKPMREDEQPVP
ncbi:cation:proton antiporter [Paracoccus sp. S-4012]|uniref:monovalent cation/H(+) antiporter subunit G n=1 Tax=Paracoccus sp. S-4012 TaxID=2665648 RepID=UPI0012AFE783|nr:monovalent cation/H(+) antiporter subunit G [Paracoccus sp. S-4012]MRX50352.1 cation:proton antiporter [Paracoccus sp. S-4012]